MPFPEQRMAWFAYVSSTGRSGWQSMLTPHGGEIGEFS